MGVKLFVGNLPFDTVEPTLRDLLDAAGIVAEEVAIVTDRATGRSRGFAFVTIATEEGARAAEAALNGKDFQGRALVVNEARPPAPRAPRDFGGFGGGGGFGGDRGGFGGGRGTFPPKAGGSRRKRRQKRIL